MEDTLPKELILRPSKKKLIGYLIGSLVFVGCGILMVLNGEQAAWFCTGFFALCAFVFALQLLPNSSYLEITEDGFTMCSIFRKHFYAWDEIDHFGVGMAGPKKMVMFQFSEEYRKSVAGRKLSSALSGWEAALPDSYGFKLEELAVLMNEYKQNKSRDQIAGSGGATD